MFQTAMPSPSDSSSSMWAPLARGPAPSTKRTVAKPKITVASNVSSSSKPPALYSMSGPLGPSSPPDMYVDPALRQIDEVVNMELDNAHVQNRNVGVSSQHSLYCLVLDTNVLLGYLDVLDQFIRDSESCLAPIQIVVPGIVVQELDYQKCSRSADLQWNARMASTWILEQLKRKRTVKGQAYGETLQVSGTWKKRDAKDMSNDDLIVDCCLYFGNRHRRVVVASADHNLCTNALSQSIAIINPRDTKKWSSRLLATHVFNDRPDTEQIALNFGGPSEIRRSKRQREALEKDLGEQPPPQYLEKESDGMEIDDGHGMDFEPSREHLLDNLHRQVLGHFTSLLMELVRRVAPQLFSQDAIGVGNVSIHSPLAGLIRKPGAQWKAADCVQLLSTTSTGIFPKSATHGDIRTIKAGSTRLASFVTDPYEDCGRKGQEWSRADWYFCLEVLECLGRVWGDEPILLSLAMLRPQVDVDFVQPMRPT